MMSFSFGKPCDDIRAHRGALAHEHDDVEIGEPRGELIEIADVIVEEHRMRARRQAGPVGEGPADILVIVENGDFYAACGISHRVLPSRGIRAKEVAQIRDEAATGERDGT